jgi:hypothetical protein
MRLNIAKYCLCVWCLAACQPHAEKDKQKKEAFDQVLDTSGEQLARGEYLVQIMGCESCHSPKVFTDKGPTPDPDKRFSGHPEGLKVEKVDKNLLKHWVLFNMHNTAVAGPWGISFSANISSDDTGIGNWTEEQFFRAMREGKSKGLAANRLLLPPMPWPDYARMKDDDLKAIFAYLKSTKPVPNAVPSAVISNDL